MHARSGTPAGVQSADAHIIQSERTPTGYRRYRADAIRRLLIQRSAGFDSRCVIYARVSSAKQSQDGNLDRQRSRLVDAAQQRGYDPVLVVAEQASGINDKRRGLWRILRLAEKRGFDVLLIEFPDRLARFGYRYLVAYLRAFDVRVETTQKTPSASFEEELARDLITIVTVFSARLYGRRSKGLRKKIAETIHTDTADSEEATHGAGDENTQIGGP